MEKRPKLVILQAKKPVNLQLFFTVQSIRRVRQSGLQFADSYLRACKFQFLALQCHLQQSQV